MESKEIINNIIKAIDENSKIIKTNRSSNYMITLIDIDDLEETYKSWKEYVDANISGWDIRFHFFQFFLGGQFDISKSTRQLSKNTDLKARADRIITSPEDYKSPRIDLCKKLDDQSELKNFSGLTFTRGQLSLNVIYSSNEYVLNKLGVESNKLFDSLKKHFCTLESINILVDESKGNGIMLLIELLFLSFNFSIYKIKEYISLIDTKLHKDMFRRFEYPIFNESLLPNTGILGSSGSLALLYHGLNFVYNKNTHIDVNTLATCCDVFYFNSANTQIDNPLEKAYECAKEAYNRGDHTVSAYNLGYYNYVYALTSYQLKNNIITDTNKTHEKYKAIFQDKDKYSTKIRCAITYFIEASKLGHGSSYTSLGNICAKANADSYKDFLDKEIMKTLLEYAQNLQLNNPILHSVMAEINDSDLKKASFIFYKTASEKGCLNGTYNFMRLIESTLVSNRLEKTEKPLNTELCEWFCECLNILKAYRHPQGTNIYCTYKLMDLLFYGNPNVVNPEELLFVNNLLLSGEALDFVPRLYLDSERNIMDKKILIERCGRIHEAMISSQNKSSIVIRDNKTFVNEKLDDVIDLYKYISGYTYEQLCYFWPIYHYCYLKYHRRKKLNEEYNCINMRKLIEKIVDENITSKESSLAIIDYQKAFLLLVNSTLLSSDESEFCYVYFRYKDRIESYIYADSDTKTSQKLSVSFKKLEDLVRECISNALGGITD